MKMVTIIVETPKGKGEKYDYDSGAGYFKLSKIMPLGLVFPFDFGYIPGTKGADGDPLDVLVLSEAETFTGCALDCRIIGGIKASQQERDGDKMRNDRFIAIPEISLLYRGINKIADLPKGMIGELETFFVNYNSQAGKQFKPLERMSAKQANVLIGHASDPDQQNWLIQLYIPLYHVEGVVINEAYHKTLGNKLTTHFGEFTSYIRASTFGLWKRDGKKTHQNEVLVYEVRSSKIDKEYWSLLKADLKDKFQCEIVILTSKIGRL